MHPRRIAIVFICLLAFTMVFQTSIKSDLPLSWDVWYHLRISRQFAAGHFLWDAGSFGPEGRPHNYPPLFHVMTAFFYVVTRINLEVLARFLPPFIFAAVIYTFYLLVKEIFTEKIAVISCLFASVTPIILDRGVSYTPEVLSLVFFNVGLLYFWKKNWILTGVMGGLLVLTHGLASAAFFSVLVFYTFFSSVVLKENVWKLFIKVIILSCVISSFWILQSVPQHVPYGGDELLRLYPLKLGWTQVLCAFLGLTSLKENKKSVFIISYAGSLLLLTRNPVSLPYRFIEFLAFPVCILAAKGICNIKPKIQYALIVLFLMSFAQGYWYTEKYIPVVTAEEKTAYTWLDTTSVEGYTIMTEWRTAPVLAFFSGKAPVKGAYQFGAPTLKERTDDTSTFYEEYPDSILFKYNISFVYYGKEEQTHQYEPPYNKVYATLRTGFYHR
jgi:4-amino-4-deoxy-L-arabinose transferase-like glycosyltransferase